MLRRRHKKSRGGCVECKRRHVKCDEGRPVCRLCTLSERQCTYTTPAPEGSLSTSRPSSQEGSKSPGDIMSQTTASTAGEASGGPLPTPFGSHSDSLDRQGVNSAQDPTLDDPINFNHMELVTQFIMDTEIFSFGARLDEGPPNYGMALQIGLKWPYVLHQVLAFTARRLAFLHPERARFYLHQAVSLQTKAVSLFNASWSEVDETNCVPILLFATSLGHHLLTDTFAKRDPGGLETFLDHYIQCIEMHRGIYIIAMGAWPLLLETELEPVLTLSSDFTGRDPKGDDCQRLQELINAADGLRHVDKEACRLAIRHLQVGFDAVLSDNEPAGTRFHMVFTWSMLASTEFTALLARRTPEVLVLLAYYAALLHYARKMWQVQDAGVYILGIVGEYLGPQWDPWLQYPRELIAREVDP